MKKQFRLVFRVVFLGPRAEDDDQFIHHVKTLVSPIGSFYDSDNPPYPKVPGSRMVRIEFDIPFPFDGGIEVFTKLLGGTGWHFTKDEHEQGAIWAAGDGLKRPFNEHFYWGEIQLIPYDSLAESRKVTRLKSQTVRT